MNTIKTGYLDMVGITKRFPGVVALNNVNFSCEQGTIHALVGENGAGKSTLMNLLGGLLTPDEGVILMDGQEVRITSPGDSFALGIGFVHQESNLLANLAVWENVFLSQEQRGSLGRLDKPSMRARILEMNRQLGYQLDPDALVGSLKLADRQLVEITRAVVFAPRILILDEPTAALSEEEVRRLFAILHALRDSGTCIIYISHRLEEVVELADRVTVLKDGLNAGELAKDSISKDAMVTMMIGRTLQSIYPSREDVKPGEALLTVENLVIPGRVEGVSLQVRSGEILGLGGLDGQGQRDFVRALFGEIPFSAGTVRMGEQVYAPNTRGIARRVSHRMGYVTHDRHGEGLILHQPIRKNMSMASFPKFRKLLGMLTTRKEAAEVTSQVERLSVKLSTIEAPIASLSGGNQQKIMLGRWLMVNPQVLIIDEPTKGVDVGARTSLYEIIDDLTRQGIAVVMLTSDMLELMGLSDRIIVFYEGRCTAELTRAQVTEEKLMRAASGMLLAEERA